MMSETGHFSMVKPTQNTPFRIDYNWWRENDNNWKVFLQNYLCPEHQSAFEGFDENLQIDWIDPRTGEVKQIDGILNTLINHCSKQPDFISEHNTIVDAAFKVLLTNGNRPMTAIEIGQRINRSPDIILRTLAGPKIYRGIRPSH